MAMFCLQNFFISNGKLIETHTQQLYDCNMIGPNLYFRLQQQPSDCITESMVLVFTFRSVMIGSSFVIARLWRKLRAEELKMNATHTK